MPRLSKSVEGESNGGLNLPVGAAPATRSGNYPYGSHLALFDVRIELRGEDLINKRIKAPSPAMIVAIVALVVAVAGTAVATPIAITSLNKKEKKVNQEDRWKEGRPATTGAPGPIGGERE